MAQTPDKHEAQLLLDRLDAEQLAAVVHLLHVMTDPLTALPAEEHEVTPETAAAIERARGSLARGEGVTHEEVLREFGLTK